jgi:hypothetical protein
MRRARLASHVERGSAGREADGRAGQDFET